MKIKFKKIAWFRMKKLDSYRLLDLFINVTLMGLSFIFVFMVSLGYRQIHNYAPEIEEFPFFIAFLPSLLSTFFHSMINFFAAKYYHRPLVDLGGQDVKKEHWVTLFLSLGMTIVSLTLYLLFHEGVIPGGEEYIYVLISLPSTLIPYAFLLFLAIRNLWKSDKTLLKKIFFSIGIAAFGVFPMTIGLATYLPALFGYTYLGVSLFPIAYVMGDAISMDKGDSDLIEKDDI